MQSVSINLDHKSFRKDKNKTIQYKRYTQIEANTK